MTRIWLKNVREEVEETLRKMKEADTPENRAQIRKMLDEGCQTDYIASAMGIPESFVIRMME